MRRGGLPSPVRICLPCSCAPAKAGVSGYFFSSSASVIRRLQANKIQPLKRTAAKIPTSSTFGRLVPEPRKINSANIGMPAASPPASCIRWTAAVPMLLTILWARCFSSSRLFGFSTSRRFWRRKYRLNAPKEIAVVIMAATPPLSHSIEPPHQTGLLMPNRLHWSPSPTSSDTSSPDGASEASQPPGCRASIASMPGPVM